MMLYSELTLLTYAHAGRGLLMRLQILDEHARYECGSCTSCCRQPWRVLIEKDRVDAIRKFDFAEYPALSGQLYFKDAPEEGYLEVCKNADHTACLFLDTDGLCIIHKKMGLHAKPQMCQQFPYLRVRTDWDDRVSVSYGCPAVQHLEGPLLADQEEDIYSAYPADDQPADVNADMALDLNTRLNSEQTSDLFNKVLGIFDTNHDMDIWQRFARVLMLASTFSSAEDAHQCNGNGCCKDQGCQCQDAQPSVEITGFERPQRAPMQARFLFAATLYPDAIPEGGITMRSFWKRLAMIPKLMSLASLSGAYASRLLKRNIPIDEVLSHTISDTLEPESNDLLRRYYRSRLWQRQLAGSRLPFIGGIHQHILDLGAIVFLARAEAHHHGESSLSHDRIKQALARVELHMANQYRLFDQVLKGWLKANLCNLALATASLRLMALAVHQSDAPAAQTP